MDTGYAVVIGLDVGKSGHHACALESVGNKLFDKPLPQDETELRKLFTGLQVRGEVLMVVDQPNTIGALPIAVARVRRLCSGLLAWTGVAEGSRSLSGQVKD